MRKKDKDKTQLQLWVDIGLKGRLENIKEQKGLSMSYVVSEVLTRHLGDFERQYNIQPLLSNSTTEK